jgi:PAS domain S-box-containing protein
MTRLRELWSRQRSVIIGSLGILFNLLYLTLDYLENPQNWSARLAQEFAQEPWLYIGLFLLIPLFVAIAVLLERTERERRRFQTLFEAANDGIYVRDLDGRIKFANSKFLEIHGVRLDEVIGRRSTELLSLPRPERQRISWMIRQAALRGEPPPPLEAPFRRPDGSPGWLHVNIAFIKEGHQIKEVLGISRDITERKRNELLITSQNRVLELLASGAPLSAILETICRSVEELAPGVLCSILLLEGDRLRHGAAPSLPHDYNQKVDGLKIGPTVGSCGTAAYLKKPVIVSDTFTDPLWADFRDLAQQYGLRACWSTPILSQQGEVLGTFAMYYREVRSPSAYELQLIERVTHMASLAIERAQTQAQLRASEQRYRSLFESVPIGLYRSTPEGRIVDANDALVQMLGYPSREKLLETPAQALFCDPADRQRWQAEMDAKGVVSYFVTQLKRYDGTPIWVVDCARAVRDPQGTILYYDGSLVDITKQKQMEDQLRASEERYRDLFENANDGIYILDRAGRIVSFNRKAEEITGYTLEEVRGQSYTLFLPPGPERKKARRAFLKNMRGQPDKTELTIIRKDGREVILELSTRPIWQGGQIVGIQGIGRDITERKELERLKSDFISTVSHELRTPLTSIKGYVDLVLAGDVGPLTPEQKEFLTIVSQNTTRLTELINDLLEIERLESGRIEFEFAELDLAEVLENVARSLHVNAEQKGLEFLTEIPSGLKVRGDRERLAQVFLNLLSNAIKYTPAGTVELRAHQEDDAVVVEVRDTGIGLSESDLQKLFQKFFRSDNPYVRKVGGTGLGLSIAKAIVERHGGTITVTSQLGQGSTFTVRLPALARPERPLVLVIEDEVAIARLIAKYIEKMGYRAVTAYSAREGFDQAVRLKPDLITLDVLMPDLDGFALIQQLKAHPETAHIPVIFLSIVQDRQQGLRLGASAFLTKPIDERKFYETVRALLEPRGQPVLVVDDDRDYAQLLKRLLERQGFSVELAHDGDDALRKILSKRYQLVILDKNLPKRSGLDVLQEMRNSRSLHRVPVIVISGSAHAEEAAHTAQILGAKKFLSKKLAPQSIVEEIVQFLESSKPKLR